MNILQIISGESWSGGQAQTELLIRQLSKKHSVSLACRNKSILGNKLKSDGYPVFFLPLSKQFDPVSVKEILSIIKHNSIHIVNAHRSKEHTLALAAGMLNRSFALCISRRVSFPLKNNILSRIKYASSRIDGYIAVSEAVKNQLIGAGVYKENIEVIYSGTDCSIFQPEHSLGTQVRDELNIPTNSYVVGIVANYSYYKGHSFFVEAMNRLMHDFPSCTAVLAGSETDCADLIQLAEKKENFRFLGFRNDPQRIMNALDILVSPALQEGLAGTIREAMALEKPVVASRTGGNPEIVCADTGFLTKPGSADEIYEACKTLLTSKNLRISMGVAARKRILQSFSMDIMVQNTERFYEKLIQNHKN